jgi:eukaryotic-like serine/threonine-protein kinase
LPLKPGTRLGSYDVLVQIGAGGMGEVYQARDTRLKRDVAIKMLPEAVATDVTRLARFQREAELLAALNHPHIAQIYGIEATSSSQGQPAVRALVLELVEGPTLADRILPGRLEVPEALAIARQIAEALEAAHEKGIIHRDLKPANIKITPNGVVKVLDFGLAKAESDFVASDLSQSPTVTIGGTREGVILGTAAYMSPEQARGLPVDKRTDVWAFGCVLFEMLTGRKPFRGETVSDTIAAILQREPEWGALPRSIPTNIRQLLQRCLQKDRSRRLRDIGDARAALEDARTENANRRRVSMAWKLASLLAGVALISVAAIFWLRPGRPLQSDRASWVQLTKFPDSVSQPALSPDGRMLTFVRGPGTFYTPGQIYVKMLPDGEPKQLTDDSFAKMSPEFSPDGSRIAYATVDDAGFKWNTWVVPVFGGSPHLWLPNASGLTWVQGGRLMFSEIKKNMHMAIVAGDESRIAPTDVYVPTRENGMAHRSYLSPDGKSVLVSEMDGPWLPCRLVSIDGKSSGRQVGPSAATCTSAAWSPDGRWMFFTSSAGGAFHIWRQRFPDGQPEQVTSGPTEEEGVAVAPDGRSLITAVGLRQRSVLLHERNGERQVSTEGYALRPILSADGKWLCYVILKGASVREPMEVWATEIGSGHSDQLLPGFSPIGINAVDIAPDGSQVVVAARDRNNKPGLWLVALDRHAPPRQIPNVNLPIDRFVFWRPDDLFFYVTEGDSGFVYRVRPDGSGLQKAIDQPTSQIQGVSPDGRWVIAWAGATMAYRVGGGPPVRLFGADIRLKWSADGRFLFIMASIGQMSPSIQSASGHTYVVPLSPGQMLPPIPDGGFRSADDIVRLPGARVIDTADLSSGPTRDVYAFSRETVQRNLYRIPLP